MKVKTKVEIGNFKIYKICCAIVETILAIPFLGNFLILMTLGLPNLVTLILGIIGIVKEERKIGHILQVISALVGWIPIIGWIFHLITAVVLWTSN